HSCDDVVMDIALSIEESLINGTPLHGIALDFAKCFDRVPQGLVLDLVEALGLHERVLAPLRHVYKYLRRRFKYPLGVGDEFKVTNGILQGCPISVVLINALLSVLSKALVSRARVSPKSFADDLYLLSRLAKLLQEGIEVTAIFGSLTGLALNEGKCASFSTSEKGPRLEVGGKAVKSVKTVKVLGVPLGTEGPVDNGRSDATVEAAARLEASPLKPRTKFRVMQTIAASAHYGAAYCANSAGGFANNSVLRTALSACLIPRSNRAKSPLATLTLVAKAHLCDPACASGYSSLRTAAKQYQKERFRLRMDALLVSGADASLKGPVGLISNLLREIRFLPAKRHSFELLSFEGATVPFSGKETLHFVREGLRLRAWRYLTTQRQGYSGIERGVDVRLLNRLWQNRATEDRLSFAIRKCIAGAVYSREWCNRKWGTDDGVCEFCDGGTPGTLLHYFWECPGPGGRWVNLRCRLDVAGVAAQNMPLCLSTRGIPPIGTPPVLVERVQKLIGTISIEMAQAQRNIATTRPWELASAAAGRYDVELARDSRELLTKQIGTRFAATLYLTDTGNIVVKEELLHLAAWDSTERASVFRNQLMLNVISQPQSTLSHFKSHTGNLLEALARFKNDPEVEEQRKKEGQTGGTKAFVASVAKKTAYYVTQPRNISLLAAMARASGGESIQKLVFHKIQERIGVNSPEPADAPPARVRVPEIEPPAARAGPPQKPGIAALLGGLLDHEVPSSLASLTPEMMGAVMSNAKNMKEKDIRSVIERLVTPDVAKRLAQEAASTFAATSGEEKKELVKQLVGTGEWSEREEMRTHIFMLRYVREKNPNSILHVFPEDVLDKFLPAFTKLMKEFSFEPAVRQARRMALGAAATKDLALVVKKDILGYVSDRANEGHVSILRNALKAGDDKAVYEAECHILCQTTSKPGSRMEDFRGLEASRELHALLVPFESEPEVHEIQIQIDTAIFLPVSGAPAPAAPQPAAPAPTAAADFASCPLD
ncbi:Retrovirus-related Pol polyprotein from type-2 retrotransposable element R2DM, partial [Diplonema papillatum]